MNIIVVGMGEVGKHIAQLLAFEFHNVVVVDSSKGAIELAEEKMDIMALNGHGASPSTLRTAQVEQADLLISVTDSDETNLLAGNLGKTFGCKQAIARVSNKEFLPKGRGFYYGYLGVDLIVNPNVLTAIEISKLIQSSSAISSFDFCDNKVQLVEFNVQENSKVIDRLVDDIKLPDSVNLVALQRDGELLLATEGTRVELNDHLFFIGLATEVGRIRSVLMKKEDADRRHVVLAGGSDIAIDVANELEGHNIELTIIEKDRDRCERLANALAAANIVHGDPTQSVLLEEIEIGTADLFVALSSSDEENLISSLLAKDKGSQKTIVLAQKKDNMKTFEQLGLDISISPRLLAANQILKFIKRREIAAVYNILDGEYELVEFNLLKDSKAIGKTLHSLNIPIEARVIFVLTQNKTTVVTSDYFLSEGDRVVFWLTPKLKPAVEKIFKKRGILN